MSIVINALNNSFFGNDAPCLTFESNDIFTLEFKQLKGITQTSMPWDGEVYYSYDKKNWEKWTYNTKLLSNTIYLRGFGNTKISSPEGGVWHFVMTDSTNQNEPTSNVYCHGDIACLLDIIKLKNGLIEKAPDNCFNSIFFQCTKLASAPEINFKELGNSAFCDSFMYCSSLLTPPALPATVLGSYAYSDMFYGSKINQLPALPAINIPIRGYEQMFRNTDVKVSTRQTAIYPYEFRIPKSGNGSGGILWNDVMFSGTKGPFTGSPSINTIYYTDKPLIE